jgi:hypothetical protein
MGLCCVAAGRLEEAQHYLEVAETGCAHPSDLVGALKAHNPAWRAEIHRLLQRARDHALSSVGKVVVGTKHNNLVIAATSGVGSGRTSAAKFCA